MFTLKIEQTCHEHEAGRPEELVGRSVAFYGVDSLVVQGPVEHENARQAVLQSWEGTNTPVVDLMSTVRETGTSYLNSYTRPGVLIEAKVNGHSEWFMASTAWLLGPDGRTIERLN